jgi:hypothetical protein
VALGWFVVSVDALEVCELEVRIAPLPERAVSIAPGCLWR